MSSSFSTLAAVIKEAHRTVIESSSLRITYSSITLPGSQVRFPGERNE